MFLKQVSSSDLGSQGEGMNAYGVQQTVSQTAPDHLQVLQTSTQGREQNKTAAMTEDEQRTSWPGPGLSGFHPLIPRTDSLETVACHLNLRRNIRHWGSFGFSSFHQGPSIPKYGITIPPHPAPRRRFRVWRRQSHTVF